MKFRGYLELIESVKDFEFNIEINGITYKVIRDRHLTQKRAGDNKPKDFNMSKSKYAKLFEEALNSKMNLSKAFSVTWASSNTRNNIISAVLKGSNFEVFGAIMNSNMDADKLYKAALQRIHITSL